MGRKRKRKPGDRDVHGILLLDKPSGMTSNDILQKIRNIYKAAKAGHTGSLDKPATGMLPVCFGEATKVSSYLLNADKIYKCIVRLGVVTSTADAEGEVLRSDEIPAIRQEELQQVLAQFIGDIEQIPPMYSALKVNGKRLYKLAYQGIKTVRQARPVTIHRIDLLNFDHCQLELLVHCSKGTYIRTLAEDIGNALGCGAHVKTLRRLATGPFSEQQMVTVTDIEHAAARCSEDNAAALHQLLLPPDSALADLARVDLPEQQQRVFRQGGHVLMQPELMQSLPTQGLLRVYDHQGLFTGIGKIQSDGYIVPSRLLHRG